MTYESMGKKQIIYDIGVIHGRFQVLHNDHLKYLLSGKALCRHLVVGITNPEPDLVRDEAADPGRSHPSANPLTYYERYGLIRAVLLGEGLGPEDFAIVPLPINLPERYQYYVPMEAVFFLSIYDQWGERKHRYFKSLGLKTHVLRKVALEQKGLSASDIRSRICAGKPWQHLVPPATLPLLAAMNIDRRLRELNGIVL
jgi:nicotinamide mononucleotide adenylyltransferase